MRVGFTGTQRGLTDGQKDELTRILAGGFKRGEIHEVHHGGCIGADEWFHELILAFGQQIPRHVHWCTIREKQMRAAILPHDVVYREEPPLIRNSAIVFRSDFVIACPGERNEVIRSGTWATIRRARKLQKELRIIFP